MNAYGTLSKDLRLVLAYARYCTLIVRPGSGQDIGRRKARPHEVALQATGGRGRRGAAGRDDRRVRLGRSPTRSTGRTSSRPRAATPRPSTHSSLAGPGDRQVAGAAELAAVGIHVTLKEVTLGVASDDVPYVPLYLHQVSIALSSKFTDPGYNYWYFLDDNYALGIKATQ
jgi:hypothetical protein